MSIADQFFLNVEYISVNGILGFCGDFGENTAAKVALSGNDANTHRKDNILTGNLKRAGCHKAFRKIMAPETATRSTDIGQRV